MLFRSRWPQSFALVDVEELRIQKYRPLRPLYPLIGMIVGGLAVGLPCARLHDDESGEIILPDLGCAFLALGGGAIGLTTGIVFASKDPGMMTIRCEPAGMKDSARDSTGVDTRARP